MEMETTPECRLCFEAGDRPDLIAPCWCSGTSKFVHRKCLNRWRSANHNPRAFTHCSECHFEYEITFVHNPDEKTILRKVRLRVARDIFLVFLLNQTLVFVLGLIVRLFDPNESMVDVIGLRQVPGQDQPHGLINAIQYHYVTYYICGLGVELFLVGLTVICLRCTNSADQGRNSPWSPNYIGYYFGGSSLYAPENSFDCCCCCFDECQCRPPSESVGSCDPKCEGAGDGGCAPVLLALLIVVVFVVIFLGVMELAFLITLFIQRTIHLHYKLVEKSTMACEYQVVDLDDRYRQNQRSKAFSQSTQGSTLHVEQAGFSTIPRTDELKLQHEIFTHGSLELGAPLSATLLMNRDHRSDGSCSESIGGPDRASHAMNRALNRISW